MSWRLLSLANCKRLIAYCWGWLIRGEKEREFYSRSGSFSKEKQLSSQRKERRRLHTTFSLLKKETGLTSIS